MNGAASLLQRTLGGIVLIALYAVTPALSQPHGHWVHTVFTRGWSPTGFAFRDSVHGVLFVSSDSAAELATYKTVNGGVTWQLSGLAPILGDGSQFHEYFNTEDGILYSCGSYPSLSLDMGKSWKVFLPPELLPTSYAGAGMFVGGFGIRVWNYGGYRDSIVVSVTYDSGATWTRRSSFGLAQYQFPTLNDALAIDTLHLWAALVVNNQGVLLSSTDGGLTWATHLPLDTTDYHFSEFSSIDASADGRRIVAVGGGFRSFNSVYTLAQDFVLSSDGGLTWHADSSFTPAVIRFSSSKNRVSRAFLSGGSGIWVFLGNGVSGRATINEEKNEGAIGHYADTLCFSSDHGMTWMRDSETFIGDTLLDMAWPDSNHGYVLAFRDSATVVYRFVPEASGVTAATRPTAESPFRIETLPVQDVLRIGSSREGEGMVEVFDLLGRLVYQNQMRFSTGGTVSVSADGWPAGAYTVRLRLVGRASSPPKIFELRFIKD